MAAKRKPHIIFIGNRAFRIRVPRGCSAEDGVPSEWDSILDKVGESNEVLHWFYIWSWCQEPIYGNTFIENATRNIRPATHRVLRGCGSARSMIVSTNTGRGAYMGYRPILEPMDPATMEPDINTWADHPDGSVIRLGSLYMDGVPLSIPQAPTDLGDIPDYIPGTSLRIGETDADPNKQLRLIKSGHLFIADRNLLKKVSWEDLNRYGLIYGD